MSWNKLFRQPRRTFLKTAVAAGVLSNTGKTVRAQEDDTFEFGATTEGWQARQPARLRGAVNPPLDVWGTHEIVWENEDGEPHGLVIEDDAGNIINQTDIVTEQDATRSVTVSADRTASSLSPARYYCPEHPETMAGTFRIHEYAAYRDGTASVTFTDGASDGSTVTVDSVDFQLTAGFIAIYEGEPFEGLDTQQATDVYGQRSDDLFLGVSDSLHMGEHTDVEVPLETPLEDGEERTLAAIPYVSSERELENSTPYQEPYGYIQIDLATITVGDPSEEIDAEILAFETDGGTVEPGDVVESTVIVENTGNVEHTFFVGYSMFSADGQEFHNEGETGTSVTLEPGEQETVAVTWIVPEDAPVTTYDAVTAIWKESSAAELDTQLDRVENEAAVDVEDTEVELTASFDILTEDPIVSEEVEFDASDSEAPNGTIEEYRWDVTGDGEADATGEIITHKFDEPGEYEVTLTVIDNERNEDSVREVITVEKSSDIIWIPSVYTVPAIPQPGEPTSIQSILISEMTIEAEAVLTLYIDEQQSVQREVSSIEKGSTVIEWNPEIELEPGEHTITVDLDGSNELKQMSDNLTQSWTIDVPPVDLNEFYSAETVSTNTNDGSISSSERTLGMETVAEVYNPTQDTVAGEVVLYVDEDGLESQTLDLAPGESARFIYFWENTPGEAHTVRLVADIDDYEEFEIDGTYESRRESIQRSLPTALAYAEGRAEIEGATVSIPPQTGHVNLLLFEDETTDEQTISVLYQGEERMEITVKDQEGNVIGEMEERMSEPTFVDVPVDMADETDYVILEIEEDLGVMKNVAMHLPGWSTSVDVLNFFETLGEYVSTGSLPHRQAQAFRVRLVVVAEVSGNPKSDDLRIFADQIGDEYAWESFRDASEGVLALIAGWGAETSDGLTHYITKGVNLVFEGKEKIGAVIEFSDVDFMNSHEIGQVDVYEYDDMPVKVTQPVSDPDREAIRYLDIKTTGIAEGTARTTVHYSEGDLTESNINEETLELHYWDEDQWSNATNTELDTNEQRITGDLPAGDLTGTPVLLDGTSDGFTPLNWVPAVGSAAGLGAAGYTYLKYLSNKDRTDDTGPE